jgi:hypothetical protein
MGARLLQAIESKEHRIAAGGWRGLYATVGQALHTENARGLLARCRPAFAIIDRPRFDVAWALARLASERGTMMHTQTTRTGRSRNLGSRRGQGQAGQAENGGSPRPRTHPRPALGHSEASARRRRSLVRPPRAAQPRRQGPRDDGGARPDAPPGERQGLRQDQREARRS